MDFALMIQITANISLDESDLMWEFVRASGPGGQRVNKASTAAQLRLDIPHSGSLPDDVKARLIELAGKKVNADGVLLIEASRFRSQERNRKDALERLVKLIQEAALEPKDRVATKPSRASRERRLAEKRRTSEKKRLRRSASTEEES